MSRDDIKESEERKRVEEALHVSEDDLRLLCVEHLEQTGRNSDIRHDGPGKVFIVDLRMIHIITHCMARHFSCWKRRQQASQNHRLGAVVKPCDQVLLSEQLTDFTRGA